MMLLSPPPCPLDSVATFRPHGGKSSKAVNILKTKGRDRDFPPSKAVNILNRNTLTRTMEIHKEHDKVSDGKRRPVGASEARRQQLHKLTYLGYY